MRIVLLVVLLGACGQPAGDCVTDADCGGRVCTRTSECLPASEVRTSRVTWMIGGQPASTAACAGYADFYLMFLGTQPGDWFGFSPVPCDVGLFTIDKLPRRFVSVEIGVDGGFHAEKVLDSQGNVAFDLAP